MSFVLDSFPSVYTRPLPDFNKDGLLDPGDYAPSKAEFEERFVDTGDVARRRFIYEGWNRHRAALQESGIPDTARVLVNGSFTTDKPSPGDIDIAVEVPIVEIGEMYTHPALKLLKGRTMKLRFQCDAHPIISLPPDHPGYTNITVCTLKYWTRLFGTTRDETPKGRVWTTIGGLP